MKWLLVLSLFGVVGAEQPLTGAKLVDHINSLPGVSWTAHVDPKFAGKTPEELKRYLGALKMPAGIERPYVLKGPDAGAASGDELLGLPSHFDAAEAWPECSDLIETVQDQNNCGSCWAVSATSVYADRLCIATHAKINVSLSSLDLMACCPYCGFGCGGGWPELAFKFWDETGVVTGGSNIDGTFCKPYPIGNCHLDPKTGDNICGQAAPIGYEGFDCATTCAPKYTAEPYANDTYFGSSYLVYNRHNHKVMIDLMKNGPLVAVFDVYEDFFNYKGGVYEYKAGGLAGGHAVRLVGWGEDKETGVKYWKMKNSWTEGWGEKGSFRIRRGTNECGIEEGFISGLPDVERSLASKQEYDH